MCCTGKSMIVTCVADVLPMCTVAGSPDQKQRYNFERRYCYYIMISVHRQLIIVDSHFHFTQHSCQPAQKRYRSSNGDEQILRKVRNNYRSCNLIGHYPFWVISPRNSTSFTRPFLTRRRARAGHKTNSCSATCNCD